jgi:VIT1/CCC1 family predicted Fe2+/Mn2+ transporter
MDTHLHHEHKELHMESSAMLSDIVIGMSDGLTVPFALAAGLSGAVSSTHIIMIAGIAVVAAGSIAMGLGGYLSGKTEQDHYKNELRREYEEMETVPEKEKKEVKGFFANLGFSEELQIQATEEISKDKDKWVSFMIQYELGFDEANPKRARNSALNIGLSYAVGGLVPLSPYFIFDTPLEALKWSAVVTLICLFVFGFFKSKITGVQPFYGALRTMLIGAVAAGAAFGIAKLFEG